MTRHQLKTVNSKDPDFSNIAETTAQKVERLWMKASLPTVSHRRVKQMILNYHNQYQKVLKSKTGGKNKSSFEAQVRQFKNISDKLLTFVLASAQTLTNVIRIKEGRFLQGENLHCRPENTTSNGHRRD